jgi:hypothetical protein
MKYIENLSTQRSQAWLGFLVQTWGLTERRDRLSCAMLKTSYMHPLFSYIDRLLLPVTRFTLLKT